MKKSLFIVFVLALLASESYAKYSGGDGCVEKFNIKAANLKCEYRTDLLGIDVKEPRLSWIPQSDVRGQRQTAYHLIVASKKEYLNKDYGDLWDSGKVNSDRAVYVLYQGKPLSSQARCYWKVRIWDKDDQVSKWSDIASWEMALLNSKQWQGRWINDGKENPEKDADFYKDDPAPLFRKEFELSKSVEQARLYISGLGYYQAYLNGQRVGDSQLDPAWSVYSKRVFYSTYDVTAQVKTGRNCIGVMVGNGWYNPLPMRMWGYLNLREHLTVGRPRLISQLNIVFKDGSEKSIVSDTTWKCIEGPLVKNNIYLGEVYDARKEKPGWERTGFDDSGWHNAKLATEPVGKLQAQPIPPIKATAVVKPIDIIQPADGTFIFDMGQNFAGWIRLKLDTPRGTKINLRYGELLNEDRTLNPMTSVCGQIKGTRDDPNEGKVSIGGPGCPEIAYQEDVYICKGDGLEEYVPCFTFHGFRYVELTGYPGQPDLDMVEGLRLNSAVHKTGSFSCSNELFNRIQEMCEWTFLSNLFSVQSDCPHREKFGYGGDLVTTSHAFMMNVDMADFYAKTVWDWHDSAFDNGMLTDTAPFVGIHYCGPAWAMVHPHLQLELYKFYGDKRTLHQQFETSGRWLELVRTQNDLVIKDGLSDHEALEPAPAEPMITALYYHTTRIMAQIASVLDKSDQAKHYRELGQKIKDVCLENFFDSETGIYSPGTQASQTFDLHLDLLSSDQEKRAVEYLLRHITDKHKSHLSTGIFGTQFLLDELCSRGHGQTAYNIVNQKTFPGWGYMLDNGATTLWEHWQYSDNTFSHNHPMFGSVSGWFYKWLAGIQPSPDAEGFDKIIIRPTVVDDLQWVKCSYDSVRGTVVSNWNKQDGKLIFDVEIPVNSEALFYIPANEGQLITESDIPVEKAVGVNFIKRQEKTVVYKIGSGTYHFIVKN
ncbi:MAG: family 78 glycoside hydrolase catalytic domain [Planctomycetota bacterium]